MNTVLLSGTVVYKSDSFINGKRTVEVKIRTEEYSVETGEVMKSVIPVTFSGKLASRMPEVRYCDVVDVQAKLRYYGGGVVVQGIYISRVFHGGELVVANDKF